MLGFTAAEVSAYLDDISLARGKPGWPESEWQAALVERFEGDAADIRADLPPPLRSVSCFR
jgi:hypothetical protein